MANELANLTAHEAAQLINAGELHPSELVEACLDRYAALEPKVRAWAYLNQDKPAIAARLLDSRKPASPLHGIPFGVKDIIDTCDMPVGYGSPIYHGHQADRDASCVALLKEAGGVCMGKTVTTELAHLHPGKTRNPVALKHTPGGSSSGSAAAVAAGMVPLALGTQTTGSVLRPASFCGVFGFKPSYGDVIRSGVFECSASLDTLGWFARCIEDIEMARLALMRAPADPLQATSAKRLRIGLFRGPHWAQADPATQKTIESTAARLESDVDLAEVDHDPSFGELDQHHRTIAGYEFARSITWERIERGQQLSTRLRNGRCEDGIQTSYEQFVAAQDALLVHRARHEALMAQYDLLLTPAAPGEAVPGLQSTGSPLFNAAWTALHVPVLSVPALRGATNLPVGLQLVGRFRADRKMLADSAAVCQLLDIGKVEAVTPESP